MGVGATAKPAFVMAQFGILDLTPAGRNEVRAVYGGFGIFEFTGLEFGRSFCHSPMVTQNQVFFKTLSGVIETDRLKNLKTVGD